MQIGVDIGGTFTDIVALDRDGPPRRSPRSRARPKDLLEGIGAAVTPGARAGRRARRRDVERFIHGTTVATNAVLEQKGAVTAILTTEGFEDVLELGPHEALAHVRPGHGSGDADVPRAAPAPRSASASGWTRAATVLVAARRGRGARARCARCARRPCRPSRSATCSRSSIPPHERRTREIVARWPRRSASRCRPTSIRPSASTSACA